MTLRFVSSAGIVAGTAVLAWLAACEPYEEPGTDRGFVLEGAHAALPCQACHATEPFGPIPWDLSCLSCHEDSRKGADHYPGQGCSDGDGCHLDTDVTWADALDRAGGVDHEPPLEGAHAIDCALCHLGGASGTADDVIPEGGNADLCGSCHEVDRWGPDHYVEPGLDLLAGANLLWDCKACHDYPSRNGAPVTTWEVPAGQDHDGIRFPHGTETSDYGANVAVVPPEQWVVACEDCHPDAPPVYTCTTACHAELFVPDHFGNDAPGDNQGCTSVGCHPNADLRDDRADVGAGAGPAL